jgi:hypothetical protein
VTWPNELPKVSSFHTNKITEMDKEGYVHRRTQVSYVGTALTLSGKFNTIVDLKMRPHVLDTLVPRDLNVLKQLIGDEKAPMEWRTKMLELVIHRGAINEFSYDEMAPARSYDGLLRQDEFNERRAYQEAARNAILKDPKLFDELSKNPAQLFHGRSAATEFMNTALRNGGMYGTDADRQDFKDHLKAMPPETVGRMYYHLGDAGAKHDVHLKGERRFTGVDGGLGVGPISLSGGLQWEYHPDNHWKEAGGDIKSFMNTEWNPTPAERAAAEKGFNDAAGRNKHPFGTPPE